MREIGFIVFENKATGLLPTAIILLLNIIQLKNFRFRIVKENEKRKALKNAVPSAEEFTDVSTEKKSETKEQIEKKETDTKEQMKLYILKKGKEFLNYLRNFFQYMNLVYKRMLVLHMPKGMLIVLFIASQHTWNAEGTLNIIGLGYFLTAMVIIPIPFSLSILWVFIIIYSQLNLLLLYAFQFPFFHPASICKPNASQKHDNPCNWFKWIGLIRNNSGNPVFYIVVVPILVQITTMFLRNSIRIKNKLGDKYTPGWIFDEIPGKFSSQTLYQKFVTIINFFGNRIFYSMGFEVNLNISNL
jgi:hypothetical protein